MRFVCTTRVRVCMYACTHVAYLLACTCMYARVAYSKQCGPKMKRATSVRAFGGKKQRLARCGSLPELFASHGSVGGTGPLDGDAEVDVLLELWSLGLMSALLLQTIAQAACLVAPRPAMKRLSHIGAEGNVRGNAGTSSSRHQRWVSTCSTYALIFFTFWI